MPTTPATLAESLRSVAGRRGLLLRDRDLSAAVRALSDIYNREGTQSVDAQSHLAARLLFSFERDRPKGAQAIREIAHLLPRDELRILDVGAGLGALTWGAYDAWKSSAPEGRAFVTMVDQDAGALQLANDILMERASQGDALRGEIVTGDIGRAVDGKYDLILVGQVLSEMDRALDEEPRADRHAASLLALAHRLAPGGYLVVIEPALRDRTRHLHRIRERLVRDLRVVAPCLHHGKCPMLASPHDWCHEDRPINLPEHLVAVARGAGLRYEGLTFSYLIMTRDGKTLSELLPGPAGRVRLVSSPRVTKGKTEFWLCGELAGGEVGSVRARLLDREITDNNHDLTKAVRGDLFACSPPVGEAALRIGRECCVSRIEVGRP